MTTTLPAYTASGSNVRVVYTDVERRKAFLPTSCIQSHTASLHTPPNDDLPCVWFGSTQEGIPNVSICLSWLPASTSEWQPTTKLSKDPIRSGQNPALFSTPADELWLIYAAQLSGRQNTTVVCRCISTDGGQNWGPINTLFDQAGTFVCQPIVVLLDGAWIRLVFLCRTQPGKRQVSDDDISTVMIPGDQGRTWSRHGVPDGVGCVHMNVQILADGNLLAVYRSRWTDHVYAGRS